MKDCYLKARAYVDWLELKETIEGENWELSFICSRLDGFNLDEEQGFCDLNYKSICATIRNNGEKCYVDNSIEIYDEFGVLVGVYDANKLKTYIKEEE